MFNRKKKEKKEMVHMGFALKEEGRTFTLENQDGCVEVIDQQDVMLYVGIALKEAEQFVTLSAPKAIEGIRYVQAVQANGKMEVQIGVEREKCYLYAITCSHRECIQIFLDFYGGNFRPDLKDYQPVMIYV